VLAAAAVSPACASGEPAGASGPGDGAGGGTSDGSGSSSGSSSGAASSSGSSDASSGGSGSGGADASSSAEAGGDADAGLPPMKTQTFLIGYSEAWFGANFGTDYTTSFDLSYVQQVFDGIVADGGHLVRLFLWEIPQGFSLAASPPYTQQVSSQFLANVDTVLTEARRRALWAYITLLDANTIYKITGAIHTWGVNLLNDTSGEQAAFNTNALGPLLGVLDAHQDNVFGVDIVNEIQACSQNGVFPDATNGPRAFLQAEAAFIKSKSPWVKVTSSAGWPSDILMKGAQYDIANGLYSGLGLDFYDLHAYDDSGSYSGATAMCNRAASDGVPIYLGEFGQSTQQTDDTIQYDATASFLNNSRALCFKGAFAWRFDPQESYLAYVHSDFSPRPAVSIMQTFGALP
jgi:hypothetical protein